ncbi:MAG TPA: MBL fold metallo-hydrolase [Candidatus Eremiobacteraceae bacterium]|nr:MBL fold metallo-hydrolase [Candidatus Eremiobacteraceae bacterium]
MGKLTFVGGASVVTGSKHLLETDGGTRLLLDCGMFQGQSEISDRNWTPPPVDPKSLDAIVLSHGHLDHCGYIPAIVQQGFHGPVFCTPATIEVAGLVLRDSAHLQEDEAQRAAKHPDRDLHKKPLYVQADVDAACKLFSAVSYGETSTLKDVRFKFSDAGHIIGSAITELWFDGKKLTFTGDLGRYSRPLLCDPTAIAQSDYVLTEATYGDRLHPKSDPQDDLCAIIVRAMSRNGVLVIPAFAIGRTQELLYAIGQLQRANSIPTVKVYVDSPMGIEADAIMERHPESLRIDLKAKFGPGDMTIGAQNVTIAQSAQDSIKINDVKSGAIVISSSGMANGGRVLHHLRNRLPRANDTICFVGFQSPGTLGSLLCNGTRRVRVMGVPIDVNAEITHVDGFSAHADQGELLRWFGNFTTKPKVFIVHSESAAASAFATVVGKQLQLQATVAKPGLSVSL